jgi:hypothetical protein
MATSMIRKAIAQRSSGVSLNSRETANLHQSNLMAGATRFFCKRGSWTARRAGALDLPKLSQRIEAIVDDLL